MKIVVLAGGLSTERDVSFVTGNEVTKALKNKGHDVILLDVFMGFGKKGDDLTDVFDRAEEVSVKVSGVTEIAPDLEKVRAMREDQSDCFFGPNVIETCQMADIVFMALHGENGENGKVQAAFDLLGVKYTGTGYLGSALAMDKGVTKLFWKEAGVPVAKGFTINKGENAKELIHKNMELPYVVKPVCGGSSIGVSIVKEENQLDEALEAAFHWEDEIIVEQYVAGREFSVGVISGKALPIIEIAPISGFYDYKNKYKPGATVDTCPAEIPEEKTREMQAQAENAARALGLNKYARIDFLMNEKQEIFALEANTLPGMTPTSLLPQEAAAVGIGFEDLCEKLIQISLAE